MLKSDDDVAARDLLFQEAAFMAQLDHPNVGQSGRFSVQLPACSRLLSTLHLLVLARAGSLYAAMVW